jgi:hypothetical protein
MSPSESRETLLSLEDSDNPSTQPLPNKELVVQLRVHDTVRLSLPLILFIYLFRYQQSANEETSVVPEMTI